jgi:hypothetical protein
MAVAWRMNMPESERRRQVAYYFGMGFLGYQQDTVKCDCATIQQLQEASEIATLAKAKRVIMGMVKSSDIEECPKHPGRYRVTAQLFKRYGVSND